MSKVKVLEIRNTLNRSSLATAIADSWDRWNNARLDKLAEWKELRNYLFATDTTTTTNSKLPWKNKTTVPKLAQIRDNLHANYLSALFPNDDWMRWEAYTQADASYAKKKVITSYMGNKVREGGFRTTMSQLLYDFIDYGNAFADVEFVSEGYEDELTKEKVDGFIGPKVVRISPLDIVFDITACSFEQAPKIVRYLKSFGELKAELDSRPELGYNKDIIDHAHSVRTYVPAWSAGDIDKAHGFEVDGFGSLWDYYNSGMVEILEFEGSIHDAVTGEFHQNVVITVIDRSHVVRQVPITNWRRKSSKKHVGWRSRPDNLWAMGPLDNLVGMQYRIDHLENIKADLFDLIAHPPLKIKGNVEEFVWEPFAQILLGEDGDVTSFQVGTDALHADTQIATLEQRMEDLAGAPRQAMGVRTPGEKTAYEVQQLENAAGRIFQEKITSFEIELLEPILNEMLESAKRNLNIKDVVRVLDDDIGAVEFMDITKEDLTARGVIRPVGARHFAARAQQIQNITGFFNSAVGQDPDVKMHISAKGTAKLFEDLLGLERFQLVSDHIRLHEQAEAQQLINVLQQQTIETDMADPNAAPLPPEMEQIMAGMQGLGGV